MSTTLFPITSTNDAISLLEFQLKYAKQEFEEANSNEHDLMMVYAQYKTKANWKNLEEAIACRQAAESHVRDLGQQIDDLYNQLDRADYDNDCFETYWK